MKKLKNWGVVGSLFSMTALVGCSTQPMAPEAAHAVPPERVYKHIVATDPKPVPVSIVRDSGMMGSAVYQHLSINGERLASIDVGERLDIRLDPGTYVFGVIPTDGFGTHTEQATEATLERGKQYFFRVMIDQSMVSRIQRYFPSASPSTSLGNQ